MGKLRTFSKELFRRRVIRVVIAYNAVFWAILFALINLKSIEIDDRQILADWFILSFGVVGILAIPLVAYLAWRYDIVPPQLVRDIKDLEAENPGLSWARLRHETHDAGFVLLAWTGGDGSKLEKRFFQPVAIGREINNDIELGDDRVSRHHAVLWAENGIWHVRDLDSANGTFIGRSRVGGTMALPQACELRFHISGPMISVHVGKAAATRVG